MLSKEILEKHYIEEKLSTASIAKKFGIKHDRTVRKWMEKYKIPRRSLSESQTIYPKTSFDDNPKLKAYLLGLRAGDFHARRIHKVIRVQSTTTHPAQIEMMEKVFGKFSHVGKHIFMNKAFNIKQCFIYCDLNESFSFIIEKPQEIQKLIMSDETLFLNFVAGYADCESSWKILRSHRNSVRFVFQISSQDKRILEQIRQKFNAMGYKTNFYLDTKSGISDKGKRTNKDIFRLMIYRTQDVTKLANILLKISNHQEKIDKMNLILKSRNKTWIEVEPELIEFRNKIKSGLIQNN